MYIPEESWPADQSCKLSHTLGAYTTLNQRTFLEVSLNTGFPGMWNWNNVLAPEAMSDTVGYM